MNVLHYIMKIVLDDKIPFIREAISGITKDAVYIKGSEMAADDVRDADALIVRTRTRCDEKLLHGSKVSFVATATIGFDHIDTEYLQRAGIEWMNCPGCNSASVAQYLRSSLILLCRERGVDAKTATVGVVGYGNVGSKVAAEARAMGFRVLVCDPPLAELSADKTAFVGMEVIEKEADIITFHVPLTKGGKYPTWHIADREFFGRVKHGVTIVNTRRGCVVDNEALLDAINCGTIKDAIIDTWENEPNISLPLLNKVYIGTPHIAGYSADGKVNADNMVIEGLCRHFGIESQWHITPPALPEDFKLSGNEDDRKLQLYNPLDDSRKLKAAPEKFEELRGNYPLRREKMD